MISDDAVKLLIFKCMTQLQSVYDPNAPVLSQIFRGRLPHLVNQHPGGCDRNLAVFEKYRIIPEPCFSCYKVLVVPRTVVELFKLMMVFDDIDLRKDNSRKCMIENREGISGYYKGYVYCEGKEEAAGIMQTARLLIDERISADISVELKHGCSEFVLAYPEYGKMDGDNAMEYDENWRELEHRADMELGIGLEQPTANSYNHQEYSLDDMYAMFAWLRYAATIGDRSYLSVCSGNIPGFDNINRKPYCL